MEEVISSLRSLCKSLSIPYVVELANYPLVQSKRPLIPYSFAKEYKVLPVEENEEGIVVAFTNPYSLQILQELRVYLGKNILRICCPKEILEEAIEKCFHKKEEVFFKASTSLQVKNEIEYDLLEENSSHPAIRFLNTILIDAIQLGASDIHFEPQLEGLSVRVRVDGVLQKKYSPPEEVKSQILTRLKVLSKLDIAEKRLPQDGRLKLMLGEREIDFRVSTIPVVQGERIVLRILDKENILLGLNNIGMNEKILSKFRKCIQASEGIVLVTGPTGSGKTTTLYSALMELPSHELNIMTIEDPVEYKLLQIAQIGVNPKIDLTFSSGLRHILRQDPDVIMVGEIRDAETAQIAIQAALTGHLVLSTLHTNDAPSAIVRLADMGIEPYLLTSSIVGVLAQRLVRKICTYCKRAYSPSKEEKKELGIGPAKLFEGAGCEKCNHSGYKGRTGIYELLPLTPKVKSAILQNIDSENIRSAASGHIEGLRSFASMLVEEGITTSKEVFRVTRMIEEENASL